MAERVVPALYDLLGGLGEKEFAPRRRALLAHARGRVLELGAGTGFNVAHYPSAVEELVLTEPSAGMLSRAMRRALTAGFPVRAVQSPAERLPFEDASFDTVVATLVLCSVDDQDRVRKHVAVYLNGDRITDRDRLSDAVGEADEVFVFQALSGG